MGLHDRIFKRLLQTFLGDFLRLVAPALAAKLSPAEAVFLDGEGEIDWPKGARRQVDLLAEVPLAGRLQGTVLVHAEVEARARTANARRLLRYSQVLQLRFDRVLLSVLLNLRGGRAGVRWRDFAEEVLGDEIQRFRYLEFGLRGCSAEEYLDRPEPLAWALSALMRRDRLSAAEHKIRCIERIAAADLSEEQGFILGRCIDAYLALRGEDQRRFEELRSRERHREVAKMEMTWLQRAEAEGLEKGWQRGLRKGMQEGRQEGRREGMQEGRQEGRREGIQEGRREGQARLLLGQLERKFGPLTKPVRSRVAGADSETLLRWGERLIAARRLEEVFEG